MKFLKLKFLKKPIALLGFALVPMLLSVLPTMSQEVLKPISPRFTPDPQIYVGKAGGDLALSEIATNKANGKCEGGAIAAPNFILTTEKDFGFLSLKVSGDLVVSILVKGPDGIYCRSGKDPELSGAWMAGNYQIWLGTASGGRGDYKLSISETSQ